MALRPKELEKLAMTLKNKIQCKDGPPGPQGPPVIFKNFLTFHFASEI